jgi:hypothetical protein
MKLICILMGLASLGLMVALVGSVLFGVDDAERSGDAAEGVDAGAASSAQQ